MLLENFIFTDSRDLKDNCQLPVIVLFCIVIAILKLVLKFETFKTCPLLSNHQLIKQAFRGFQVRKINTRFNVRIPILLLINNVGATNVLDHELDVNAHLVHLDRLIRIQVVFVVKHDLRCRVQLHENVRQAGISAQFDHLLAVGVFHFLVDRVLYVLDLAETEEAVFRGLCQCEDH